MESMIDNENYQIGICKKIYEEYGLRPRYIVVESAISPVGSSSYSFKYSGDARVGFDVVILPKHTNRASVITARIMKLENGLCELTMYNINDRIHGIKKGTKLALGASSYMA